MAEKLTHTTRTRSRYAENWCEWCGNAIEQPERGRRRKYCCDACKQRAYEYRVGEVRRIRLQEFGPSKDFPPGTVVLSPQQAQMLRDALFSVRCGAEDIIAAITEGGSRPRDVADQAHEVLRLARKAEHYCV